MVEQGLSQKNADSVESRDRLPQPPVRAVVSPARAELERQAGEIAAAATLERRQKVSGNNGTYRVLQDLGSGGNSAVYLVEAMNGQHRGVLFALKVFLRIADQTRKERFDAEVKFLQSCNHPSIMRVFDHGDHYVTIKGEPKQFPFVVTEYLPKTLRAAMMAGLSVVEKTVFTLQLLSALDYLAAKELVHRDIKPENIFVKGRSAVLGDFGLLKAGDGTDPSIEFHIQGSTGIRFPRVYPTPDLIEYCKERDEKKPLTPKSDVFQLGLVIAEMFTSDVPLVARAAPFSPVQLTTVGRIGGAQGDAIRAIIGAMLEMEKERRPSASELFDPWEGIFLQLVDVSQQLEGRVFEF